MHAFVSYLWLSILVSLVTATSVVVYEMLLALPNSTAAATAAGAMRNANATKLSGCFSSFQEQ